MSKIFSLDEVCLADMGHLRCCLLLIPYPGYVIEADIAPEMQKTMKAVAEAGGDMTKVLFLRSYC